MPLGRTKSRRITPTDVARAKEQRQLRLAVGVLALPLVAFLVLIYGPDQWDPAIVVLPQHFYIVSVTALVALAMAVVVGVASVRTREPRTLFLACGFLAVAGIFSVHGLMTPGATRIVHEQHNGLLISARLSLLLGSLLFLMATFRPAPRVRDAIARHHGRLMASAVVLVAGYIALNLLAPAALDWLPTGAEPSSAGRAAATTPPANETVAERIARVRAEADLEGGYGAVLDDDSGEHHDTPAGTTTLDDVAPADPPLVDRRTVGLALSYLVMVVSLTAGGIAAWRYAKSFALTRSEAAAGMAAGSLLLAESHIVQTFGEAWRLSWWLYHGMMLVGFLIPMAAFARAYRRGSSLVEIVDGLVLSETLAKVEYSFPEAVNDFISVVEARDVFLRGHMRRVCELAVAIGDELRLTDTELRAASYAALLHDLGKLGMPPGILHKPGRLTDDEFEVLKEHPARGYQMVRTTEALAIAAPAIRWHHERLDGTGYPDHLEGDQIPIEARIIAVADVWDALTSDRVYRDAMSPRDAWAIIDGERSTKLDPACVDALARVLARRAAEQPPRPATVPTSNVEYAAAS